MSAGKGRPNPKRRGKRLPKLPKFEGAALPEGSEALAHEKQPTGREGIGGRPTDYRPQYCATAAEMFVDGGTDIEVADTLQVSVSTLYRWKARYPEFRDAMELGKEAANKRVERSLYNRAVGYSFESVKVFQFEGSPVIVPVREHVPPDVGAAKHWLANRDRENWSKAAEGNLTADAAFLEMLKLVSGGRP
jgi:hypothetical protein